MTRKSRLKWYGKKAERVAVEAAMKALMAGGEAILTEAIDETPIDTGTLRRSGTVTRGGLPRDSGKIHQDAKRKKEGGQEKRHKRAFVKDAISKDPSVYVSFNTPYARKQHEEIGYAHPRGGKAKYLEDPFRRNKKKVADYVERQVKQALRSKG